MPGVDMQWAGYDHSVDVLHVEQAAVIVEGLNAGHFALRLVAAAAVDVRHCHDLHAVDRTNLPQQITPAIAPANHAEADAVVRSQHGGRWRCQPRAYSARARLDVGDSALALS